MSTILKALRRLEDDDPRKKKTGEAARDTDTTSPRTANAPTGPAPPFDPPTDSLRNRILAEEAAARIANPGARPTPSPSAGQRDPSHVGSGSPTPNPFDLDSRVPSRSDSSAPERAPATPQQDPKTLRRTRLLLALAALSMLLFAAVFFAPIELLTSSSTSEPQAPEAPRSPESGQIPNPAVRAESTPQLAQAASSSEAQKPAPTPSSATEADPERAMVAVAKPLAPAQPAALESAPPPPTPTQTPIPIPTPTPPPSSSSTAAPPRQAPSPPLQATPPTPPPAAEPSIVSAPAPPAPSPPPATKLAAVAPAPSTPPREEDAIVVPVESLPIASSEPRSAPAPGPNSSLRPSSSSSASLSAASPPSVSSSSTPSASSPSRAPDTSASAPPAPAPADVQRLAPSTHPDVTVVRTAWHPKPERRSARIRLRETGETLTVREGDAVAGLVLEEITPSSVVFDAGGIEIRRRVGESASAR